MADLIKVDESRVDTTSAEAMASIVSGIDLQGVSPPKEDVSTFTLKTVAGGVDLAATDAALTASLNAKKPAVQLGSSMDATTGKPMPTIVRKAGSTAVVKIPSDRHSGDVYEKIVPFTNNGVTINKAMKVARIEDDSGNLVANLLTSKTATEAVACGEVAVRFIGTEDAASAHNSVVAASLNHGVAQIKNTFALQKNCDADACGCEDP